MNIMENTTGVTKLDSFDFGAKAMAKFLRQESVTDVGEREEINTGLLYSFFFNPYIESRKFLARKSTETVENVVLPTEKTKRGMSDLESSSIHIMKIGSWKSCSNLSSARVLPTEDRRPPAPPVYIDSTRRAVTTSHRRTRPGTWYTGPRPLGPLTRTDSPD